MGKNWDSGRYNLFLEERAENETMGKKKKEKLIFADFLGWGWLKNLTTPLFGSFLSVCMLVRLHTRVYAYMCIPVLVLVWM